MTADAAHPTPAATRAVLVAVEDAPIGQPLPGVVTDALLFADWLIRKGVRPDRITALLSPVPNRRADTATEADRLGITPLPATADGVHDLFETLEPDGDTDTLVVYWAGHGVDDRDETWLFLADSSLHRPVATNLDALLHWLRGSRFRHQSVLIDACRTQATDLDLPDPLRRDFPQRRFDPGVRQTVLLAARPGTRTVHYLERGTTWFAETVRPVFAGQRPEWWPPDLHAAYYALLDAARGGTVAGPALVSYRDGTGFTLTDRVAGATIVGNEPARDAIARRAELGMLLSRVESMEVADHRQQLVRDLGELLGGQRPRAGTDASARRVVDWVDRQRGGLASLRFVVETDHELFPPAEKAVFALRDRLAQVAGGSA